MSIGAELLSRVLPHASKYFLQPHGEAQLSQHAVALPLRWPWQEFRTKIVSGGLVRVNEGGQRSLYLEK